MSDLVDLELTMRRRRSKPGSGTQKQLGAKAFYGVVPGLYKISTSSIWNPLG